MALISTPALHLPTFPNKEKAPKPVAVRYFSGFEGKKQTRPCRTVMVCKQFSITDPPFPSGAGCGDMGVLEGCVKVGGHQLCPLRSICCGDHAELRATARWAAPVEFLLLPL